MQKSALVVVPDTRTGKGQTLEGQGVSLKMGALQGKQKIHQQVGLR
jgi:hypothetical protein